MKPWPLCQIDRPASFNQRKALFNMRSALEMDVKGIRNMTWNKASEEITVLMKRIKTEGFPEREPDLNPDGMADYINMEARNGE